MSDWQPESASSTRAVVVATLVVLVVVQGLLPLNDGIFWDGWLTAVAGEEHDWNQLYQWYHDSGLPQVFLLHKFMFSLPGTVWIYKILAFVCIGITGLSVGALARTELRASPLEATLLAIACIVHPSCSIAVELIMSSYMVSLAAFWAGTWALFHGARTGRRVWRAVAVVLWLVSYATPSFLMLQYVVVLGFFLATHSANEWRDVRGGLRILMRNLDLWVVPIAYFGFMKKVFPTTGNYTHYNEPILTHDSLATAARRFFVDGIAGQASDAVRALGVWGAMAVLAGFVVVTLVRARRPAVGVAPLRAPSWLVLLFAVGMLVAAIVPYVLVGKAPSRAGWDLRNGLLLPVPLSLAVVVLARMATRVVGVAGDVVRAALVVVLAGSGVWTVQSHVMWLARRAQDHALVHALRSLGPPAHTSVLWVDDRLPPIANEGHRYYEYSGLFHEAWHERSIAGFSWPRSGEPRVASSIFSVLNGYRELNDFDADGGHSKLTLLPGPAESDRTQLALDFVRARFTSRAALDALDARTVTTTIAPIDAPGTYVKALAEYRAHPASE